MHLALSYLVRLCVAISPSVPGCDQVPSYCTLRSGAASLPPPYPTHLPLGGRMLVAPFTLPPPPPLLGMWMVAVIIPLSRQLRSSVLPLPLDVGSL